jgi:hypothetical protein
MKGNDVHNEPQKDMVVVSGFGWSGSGALVDYLREHSRIKTAGDDEIIFFWALNNLFDQVRRGKPLNSGKGEFELLFCARVPEWYSRDKRTQYEDTFSSYFAEAPVTREEYSQSAEQILEKMEQDLCAFSTGDAASNAVTAAINLLSDIFASDTEFFIYDNLFHPQQLGMFEHADLSSFSTFRVYCVDRDPRDQFFEHYNRYQSGLGLWHQMNRRQKILKTLSSKKLFQRLLGLLPVQLLAARVFCRMYAGKRHAFRDSLSRLSETQPNMDIKKIMFEDFVTDRAGQRSLLKKEIDTIMNKHFGSGSWEHGSYFDPSISEKNIGKYRLARHQQVFEYIRKKTQEGR